MNLWVVFITGLTVGGLTCLAVQGGLLASVIAAREEEEVGEGKNSKNAILPTLAFLVTKLLAYTALGLLLGAFGGVAGISQTTQIFMQFVAGLYMVAVALNLLNVHPMFRYVIIQPPKFLARLVRNQSRSKAVFAPGFLGAMTIFIPCGTTLAMEALAVSSASPISGGLIMATFVLGTSPLFFGVGWLTSMLGDTFRTKFLRVAALGVLYLGITSVNGSLVAAGSPVTIQSGSEYVAKLIAVATGGTLSARDGAITQNPEIRIGAGGYSPALIRVKAGIPVTLTLINQDAYTCASAFRIPSLGISENVGPNQTKTITFTPMKAGSIPFSCSMGMYRGVIEVL